MSKANVCPPRCARLNCRKMRKTSLAMIITCATVAIFFTAGSSFQLQFTSYLPNWQSATFERKFTLDGQWWATETGEVKPFNYLPALFRTFSFHSKGWCKTTGKGFPALKELCGLYHDGLLTGSLCPALCDTQHIQVVRCVGDGSRKQVMEVNCTDSCIAGSTVRGFLKTTVMNITEALHRLPALPADVHLPNTAIRVVLTSLHSYMTFLPFPRQDALKVMWGDLDLHHANATLRSLSLLLGQAEYVLSKALGEFRGFPEIYGSCGHFYLQESCPALNRNELKSWRLRAGAALGILQALRRLESPFPDPVIACDSKIENFGVCRGGEVRLLDSGDAFFNASMSTAIGKMEPCTENSQCRNTQVFGCDGVCNQDDGTCYMVRNENLEFVCRRLFVTNVTEKRTDRDNADKLLKEPPLHVAPQLDEALRDCANLSHLLEHVPGAGQIVMERLETVLKESLDE